MEAMEIWRVDRRVGNWHNDDPWLAERFGDQAEPLRRTSERL
jgi:hypothetical protein